MYWRGRKGKIERSRYLEERKKFKTILEEVQKEKRRLEEEELKNMKREADVWKFINKKRGVKKWNDNDIEEEEWRRHFMELLEGLKDGSKTEGKDRGDKKRYGRGDRDRRSSKSKKLKVKKAAGVDGIPMEAWKYAGSEVVKELVDLIKTVWKQGTLPSDWRKNGAAV